MYCSNCGFNNEEGMRFCINCGQQLVPPPSAGPGMMPPSQAGQAHQPQFPGQATPPQRGQTPSQIPDPRVVPPPQFSGQTVPPQWGQVPPQAPGPGMTPYPQFPGPAVPARPAKKKKKGLIVALSILGVLILLIAGFLIYSLPLKPKIILDGTRQTLDGSIDDLSLSVKTNQLITEVRYALDPEDPEDPDAYTVLEDIKGGMFSKEGKLPKLSLDTAINKSSKERGPWQRTDANAKLGNHTLYITVKTMFGTSKPMPFNLLYASGISALPDRTKIKKVTDGELSTDALINEILVSLDMGADRSIAEGLATETGGKIVGEITAISRYQIRYDKASEDEIAAILEDLRARPEVLTAQYNYVYDRSEIQLYPNDALLDSWDLENPDGNNWGLEVIRAPLVWKDIDSFTPISVGIADGGLEYDHEDLNVDRSNIYLFPTYTLESLDDMELYYTKSDKSPGSNYYGGKEHGTHVTGIISAQGDNDIGCAGVNWQTKPYFFHYWHMEVEEDTGELDLWNVTTSFELEITLTTLVEQGCRVINYSVGDSEPTAPGSKHEYIETQAYGDLCLRLESLGYDFLVFKAAGNETEDASAFAMNRIMTGTDEARRHTVIVGAIENTPIEYDDNVDERIKYAYQLSGYSNYGSLVDVAAPGTDVFSTVPNNGYENKPGTSMASPMAAGVASLIYGAHPEYTASQVKAILKEETDTFTTDGTNLIPVVNAALVSDYAKKGELPEVPPGEVIPDPSLTPYPGPPTPSAPRPDIIELPDHTPFQLEAGQGGIAGFIRDQETESAIALFKISFTAPDGEVVTLDYAYPYPESSDARLMGEFFARIPVEAGQEAEISNFVVEARGYTSYEIPSITVLSGEITDLNIYLEAENADIVRLPGHTPFTPPEGTSGIVGFVCDDVTKERIPDFSIDMFFKDREFNFDVFYPPPESYYAQLLGEFIIWVTNDSEDIVDKLVISADGYESVELGSLTVRHGEVTDAGIVYLKPTKTAPTPSPAPTPGIIEPTPEPKPVKPAPGDDVITIPGHTPFTPRKGRCGFTGFVYDAVTKQPVSSFSLENIIWLSGIPGDSQIFDWPYPEDLLAKIEGEFIIWVDMARDKPDSDTMQAFDIVADGYETYHVEAFPVEERAVTDLGVIYLTPKGTNQPPSEMGQIAVILDWGAKPADLDLHATAPLTDGDKRFHIFAYEPNLNFGSGRDYPEALMTSQSDSSYGSESITIFTPRAGVPYTFYVHDFTNTAKKSDAWDLANSNAEVRVYLNILDEPPIVFNVPNEEGTLWEVCTIIDGEVSSTHSMSYEGRPLNIGASDQ
ncbi:MAG: S8 family serine peptidase [Saccharofermentanales bacterium]|jgi:hypothetical protein